MLIACYQKILLIFILTLIASITFGINAFKDSIKDKNVNIPAATSEALGLARPDTKTLSVDEQGVFSIKAVSTDLLVEGEDELILYGGNANS